MINKEYDEQYLNNYVVEHEDGEIQEVDIQEQRYILTDGSTFKCHIHEIDDTIEISKDSFSDQEDL